VDPRDLEQQLAQLHPASFAWALACCRWDAAEAEEVLQSTYLRILEGRARFSGRSSLKTWLFSVVRNVAADGRRRRWLHQVALGRWLGRGQQADSNPGAPELLESEERGARVRHALSRLAVRQREVLELVFFQGLTIEQAAQVMGVALGTARVHYQRAKLRLLATLDPEEGR
jgi:RNA polymerase sigma-70 factor, ECF subfamily